jgi:type I restriction enzyme M protein
MPGVPSILQYMSPEQVRGENIDASKDFMKDGPKNRLRAQDIHRIVDVFNKQLEVPKYSRMVSVEEIEKKNDFNLNLTRYIDSQEPEDIQDIEGHLKGGIPTRDIDALSDYWTVCPTLRHGLFKQLRPGYLSLAVAKDKIKPAIYKHPEFATFITTMNCHFKQWRDKTAKRLRTLKVDFHPKELIVELGEDVLAHYKGKPLLDAYDVYQHLMDYWATTMQDDAYLIAADGWKAETYRVIETKKGKDGKPDKTLDRGWTCDLIPKNLIVARYYAKEQAAIDQLSVDLEAATSAIAELEEEESGDEGGFTELDKVNRANVTARLKEIKNDPEAKEERAVLNTWLQLNEKETELKKKLRHAEAALDKKAYEHYPKLTEADVKTIVVDDKWLAALEGKIHSEMARISHRLTDRIRALAERYETPLPQMERRMDEIHGIVAKHLERMGYAWK